MILWEQLLAGFSLLHKIEMCLTWHSSTHRLCVCEGCYLYCFFLLCLCVCVGGGVTMFFWFEADLPKISMLSEIRGKNYDHMLCCASRHGHCFAFVVFFCFYCLRLFVFIVQTCLETRMCLKTVVFVCCFKKQITERKAWVVAKFFCFAFKLLSPAAGLTTNLALQAQDSSMLAKFHF